jgi:hypothetical protein
LIVVVPVCPAAKVPAERFDVEAFAKVAVPLKVGDAEKTKLPVPVSSVTSARSSAEVSMSVAARKPSDEVDVHCVVLPLDCKICPLVPAEPLLSKSLRMVARVVDALVVDEREKVAVPVKVGLPLKVGEPLMVPESVEPLPTVRRSEMKLSWSEDDAETIPFTAWSGPESAAIVSEGVVSVPLAAIVVVPVCPAAKVLAERFEVEAFTIAAAVAMRDGVVRTPAAEIEVVADWPAAKVPAERFDVEAFAKVAVPLKVGDAEKTKLPVPVSSVTIAKSFADVSREVVAIFALKVLQSAEVKRPRAVGDAEGTVKVCMFPVEVIWKSLKPLVVEAKVCDEPV